MNGLGTGFVICGAVAYVDTLVLLCWHPLPPALMSWLRKNYGKRLIVRKLNVPEHPKLWRGLVTIHQPDVGTLKGLAAVRSRQFVIHAVHLAIDFLVENPDAAILTARYLGRVLLLKWRGRAHKSRQYQNTTYSKQDSGSARNIAVYGDHLSKTGLGACCHLEFRFTGTSACRRAGVGDFATLIDGCDMMALLKRQAKIAFIDRGRLERSIDDMARRTLRRQKNRCGDTVNSHKERITHLLARLLEEDRPLEAGTLLKARAQNFWDRLKGLRHCLKYEAWTNFTPLIAWHHWHGGGGGGHSAQMYPVAQYPLDTNCISDCNIGASLSRCVTKMP